MKPKRKDWSIVTDYLSDNVMEFENYFERQSKLDHVVWRNSSRLPSYSYNGLKVFKKRFIKMYLEV